MAQELEPNGNIIYLSGDNLRALEDEVWVEYEQLYPPDDAIRRFLGWRALHKEIPPEAGGSHD